jgi:DNA primase
MTPEDYQRLRIDNIKEQIQIIEVLQYFGHQIVTVGMEQQYSCDLHGDTVDQKQSARVYPAENNTFCFACGKARDAIDLVREKLDMRFWEALRFLERHFHVEEIPSAAEFGFQIEDSEEVAAQKQQEEDIKRMANRVEIILRSERSQFEPETHLKLFHILDTLNWDYDKGARKPEKVMELLDKLRLKSIKLASA